MTPLWKFIYDHFYFIHLYFWNYKILFYGQWMSTVDISFFLVTSSIKISCSPFTWGLSLYPLYWFRIWGIETCASCLCFFSLFLTQKCVLIIFYDISLFIQNFLPPLLLQVLLKHSKYFCFKYHFIIAFFTVFLTCIFRHLVNFKPF